MTNIAIASQWRMENAVLTSGPSAPAGPASNLIVREPSRACILTDDSQFYVVCDLGAAMAIRLIAPLYVSASASCQWRVRAAANEADLTAAPAYDSGWMDFAAGEDGLDHRRGYKHDWLIPASAQTYRFWRLDFDDPDAENGQLIIGNLVLDNPFIPSQLNYSHQSQEPWLYDPSRKPTAVAGQRDPLNRRPYFIADIVLEYVTRNEAKGSIGTLTQKVGTTDPVLAIFNPDETDYRQSMAIFGLIDELRPLVVPVAEIYQTRMRIEELIP